MSAVAKAQAQQEPHWVMVIDLARCSGCETCTVSCKAENRTPPGISYNVVIETESGRFPNTRKTNLPRPCMQCEHPPCVSVCPVGATFVGPGGIVCIDQDLCIGCRYCIAACPYGSRYFDFGDTYGEMIGYPAVTAPEYGVKRGPRTAKAPPVGTVRKCSFCLHRINRGEEPACVESCLCDARWFGDLNDPESVVARLAASPRAFRLKDGLGTAPSVIYLR